MITIIYPFISDENAHCFTWSFCAYKGCNSTDASGLSLNQWGIAFIYFVKVRQSNFSFSFFSMPWLSLLIPLLKDTCPFYMYTFLLFKTPFDLLYLLFFLGIFLYFIPQISPQIKNKCLEAGISYIW